MTVEKSDAEPFTSGKSGDILKPIGKRVSHMATFFALLLASLIITGLPSAWAVDYSSNNYPSVGSVTITEIGQTGTFDIDGYGCGWTGSAVVADSGVATVSPTAISASGIETFTVTAAAGGETSITITWAQDGNPVVNDYGDTNLCNSSGSITIFIYIDLPLTPVGGSGSDFPDAGTDGDPVNTHTGELFFTEPPDINLGGPLPLRFQRYYASRMRVAGIGGSLGNNWRHNFEWSIHWTGNLLSLVNDKGKMTKFHSDGAGSWTQDTNLDTPYEIQQPGSEIIVRDPGTKLFYTFSVPWSATAHKLTKIEDGKGNVLYLNYGTNGFLNEITDNNMERKFELAHDANGYLYMVREWKKTSPTTSTTDRTVWYGRDTSRNLTRFTDVYGYFTDYAYAAPDGADKGQLISKTLPEGNTPYTQTYYTIAESQYHSGKVKTQTDAYGNTQTFTYSGNTTTMTDPNTDTTQHTHSANGELQSVTDKNAKTLTLGSAASGARNSITDRRGNTTSITIDPASGKASSISLPDGNSVSYQYTPITFNGFTFKKVSRIDYPDGTFETFQYDAAGNLTTKLDRILGVTAYTYNARGQMETVTTTLGGTTTFTYNTDGTLNTIQDHSGNVTSHTYDNNNRLITVTHADTTTKMMSYNKANQVMRITDENWNFTDYAYDMNGNMTSMTDRTGAITTFTYDLMDRLLSVTDPAGNTVTRTYDSLGRPSTFASPSGNTMTINYDKLGRVASVTDNTSAESISQGYTAEGTPASSSDPANNTATIDTDSMGRVTGVTSPQGDKTSITHNAMGLVTGVTKPNGDTIERTYGPGGVLTGVTLASAVSASYTRNAIGQITRVTDPNGNFWDSGYDLQGRLTSNTDPLAKETTYGYDSRNRLSNITFPDTSTVAMTYDGVGNVTQRAFSTGLTLNYTYDEVGRLITGSGIMIGYDLLGRKTNSNGITATYDPDNNLATVTLSTGKIVTYTYDSRKRLTGVSDWVGGTTAFAYDSAGRLSTITRPNGVITTYTYDNDSNVTGITEGALSSITLARNSVGEISSAARSVPVAPAPVTATTARTFDAASQVSTAGFSYDSLGRTTADGTRTYTWDGASRLTNYTEGATTVDITYDAHGRMLSRTNDGGTTVTNYVWNNILGAPAVSVVKDKIGTVVRYYIHTPTGGLLHAVEADNTTRYFYHYDESGNTLFTSDNAGAVVNSYAYSPYGEIIGSGGAVENPFTYQGRAGVMQEGTTGLYYNKARYYDASNGRFLSRDSVASIGPKSINPYQYAMGNPKKYADPNGFDALVVDSLKLGHILGDEMSGAYASFFGLNPNDLLPGQLAPDTESWHEKAPASAIPEPPSPVPTTAKSPGDGDQTERTVEKAAAPGGGINPDWQGVATQSLFEGVEKGLEAGAKNADEAAKAAKLAKGAKAVKTLGTAVGALTAAYDEATDALAEGQGTGTVVTRAAASAATDVAVGVAFGAPLAIADAATGGNFSHSVKQVARIGTTLANGDEKSRRAYNKAVTSGQYGAVAQEVNRCGEQWAEEGIGGMFTKLYGAFAY